MKMVSMAIHGAERNDRHSGICGQAPSDYPEFAEFIVREGIDSMSLNPDSIMKITLKVLEIENKLSGRGSSKTPRHPPGKKQDEKRHRRSDPLE